jgi:hypothetical protein
MRSHGLDRRGRQDAGIRAADDQHGHAQKRNELVPERRQRPLDIDVGQRPRDLTACLGQCNSLPPLGLPIIAARISVACKAHWILFDFTFSLGCLPRR